MRLIDCARANEGGFHLPGGQGWIYNYWRPKSGGRRSMNSRFGAVVARFRTQRAISMLAILLTLAVGILIGTVLSRGGVRGSSVAPDGSLLPAMQTPQQLS